MTKQSNYYHKYKKYREKYLELKNNKKVNYQKNNTDPLLNYFDPSNFYVLHTTKNFDSLINILQEGKIKPGKDLPEKYWHLTGHPLDCVYGSLYFPDIQNLKSSQYFDLILHPKIILKYGAEINQGWSFQFVKINKKDNDKIILRKMKKVKDYLSNPSSYNIPKIISTNEWMNHQIIICSAISLQDNLLGIICSDCDNYQMNQIKQLVNNDRIYISNQSSPLPDFE